MVDDAKNNDTTPGCEASELNDLLCCSMWHLRAAKSYAKLADGMGEVSTGTQIMQKSEWLNMAEQHMKWADLIKGIAT